MAMSASCRAARSCLLVLRVAALLVIQHAAASSADFNLGDQATVQLPPAAPHRRGFAARNVVLSGGRRRHEPRFAAAVSAEAAAAGRCACSLVVLLGDVKVWASDHLGKFVAAGGVCRLELAADGQLRLTDGAGAVGWASGTAGQGVKALHLDGETGNLVLLDAQNRTTWQSFDGATDVFLSGQRRTLPWYLVTPATKMTSSAAFFSFELDGDKIAAYVNLGEGRYSYWELAPRANETMASASLDGTAGLRMLDTHGATVARISPPANTPPVSYLALGGDGNLGMYFYEAHHQKFRASYMALEFCELPLSCGAGEVCSAPGRCEHLAVYADGPAGAAGNATGGDDDPCRGTGVDECMVHLRGVTTVLRDASPAVTNVTKHRCVELCARSPSCRAALYAVTADDGAATVAAVDRGVCSHYTVAAGAREVTGGDSHHRYSYWVKLRARGGGRRGGEGDDDGEGFHGTVSKILMVCGAIDVVCAVVFAVLVALYFRRLHNLAAAVDEPQQGEVELVEEQNNNAHNAPQD
ncbi:hypothetical protein ACP4OV_019785 [Aristida adscensionis]